MTTLSDSFSQGFFNEEPGIAFQTAIEQSGLSRGRKSFFRRNSSEFLDQFKAALGQQVLGGNNPDLNPLDFFQGRSSQGFNFRNEFLSRAPSERGFFSNQFRPNTRFLFNF